LANYLTAYFTISNAKKITQQLLLWANTFNSCCYLNSNGYNQHYQQIEAIIAVDAVATCIANQHTTLEKFFSEHKGHYIFGNLNYEYYKVLQQQSIEAVDENGFPIAYFFVPSIIIEVEQQQLKISSLHKDPNIIFEEIINAARAIPSKKPDSPASIQQGVSRQQYIDTVQQIITEIKKGNCYELNYCIPFTANTCIEPLAMFEELNNISPNPFAAFYKVNEHYLLCASPERYTQKQGTQIISQPIKGTFKRNTCNNVADEILKQDFYTNPKERSENVMVVDLVRNDLSRICKQATVQVTELFGVYTFPQVHQMISTIQGEVDENINFATVIEHTFPMGSMTGAPKQKVIQLIEQFEPTERGIYSGTIGYITPNNNFDFNVVIRSMVYNSKTGNLQYHVGSGITANSIAENEYEECLLKASAMQQIIAGTVH
jgi:para-aminobenzoate synthetase component I